MTVKERKRAKTKNWREEEIKDKLNEEEQRGEKKRQR